MIQPADRELLTAHVLKKDRSWVVAHSKEHLSAAQRKQLTLLLKKRARGWPMQYLLGHAWFYGRKFFVQRGTLIPRPETELLVEKTLASIPKKARWNVFDIGCGSGIIGITIALERPRCCVFCSDMSQVALAVARKNARALNTKNNQKIHCVHGSLLTPLRKYFTKQQTIPAVIVANLPYLSQKTYRAASAGIKKFEPKLALLGGGCGGTKLYETLFQQICHLPTTNHKLIKTICIEIDPHQTKKILRLAEQLLPSFTPKVYQDLYGDDRVVIFRG